MMNLLRVGPSPRSGFTIVELLIVVVVIAILATITIVSYNGITQRARDTSTKSDISTYAQKLELDRVLNNGFDTSIISNYLQVDTAGATLAYKYGDNNGFCMEGVSKASSASAFYVDTSGGVSNIQSGSCPATSSVVSSRCVVGKVVLSVAQRNYSSEIINEQISTIYGGTAATLNPDDNNTYAYTTHLVTMPRGVVSIAMTGPTFSITRFHAYDARTC